MKSAIRAASFIGVSLLTLSLPAFAQEAPVEDEGASANEIVVQARRKDESAQDVPVVVQAVTSEDIAKLNLRKFEDVTSVVPGLSMGANANGIGVTATVRGVNYDVNVSGNNGTIQFYQNDVPVAAGLLFNALFDVGQIEVLRGPQGTLKGRSAPSGSITVYTRRPNLSEVGGNADITVNDLHGFNTKAALNIPVIADKLGVRIAGVVAEGRGNDVRDIVNTQVPSDKTKGLRASVRANPLDDMLMLDFAYQVVKRDTIQFGQQESVNQVVTTAAASPVTIFAKDRQSAIGTPQTNNQLFQTYDWQAKLNLAGQSLTYVGGYSRQHLQSFAPSDTGSVFAVDSSGGVDFGQPTDTVSHNSSHEVRLQNVDRIGGIFDYVVGALWAKGDSDTLFKSVTGIAIAPPFSTPARLVNVVLTPIARFGENSEQSYFANLTAHLGDRLELSGGIRSITYKDNSGLAVNGVVNPLFNRNFTEKKTVYQAAAKFNVTDDVMVYASTGTSWRPSTVAIGGPTGGVSARQAGFLATGPETSESYEAGIKTSLLDRTVTFNLTGYYQKFQNYPYRASSGIYAIDRTNSAAGTVTPFNYVSGVPVDVKGFEAELAFRPNDNISLSTILAYSKGRIKDGLIPCLDLNNDGAPDIVSAPPTLAQLEADVGANNIDQCTVAFNSNLAPSWSGTVQGEYNVPLSDSMNGYLRGLFTWKGNSVNDPVNAFDDVKSYGLLNMYAGVRAPDGQWEVSLYGKNITNTFRVLNRSNGPSVTTLRGGIPLGGPVTSSGPLSTSNYYGIGVTEPREFGINLRLAFGSR